MSKEEITKDFELRFNKLKQELKFKANLEEIDKVFYITDGILKDGFISKNLSRQICYRIVELYLSWNEYLHGLIMPNPQNILNLSESKILTQDEKKKIMEIIKKIMELNSRNILISLTNNKVEEGKFIDDSFNIWKNEVGPEITIIIKKINDEWGRNENTKKKKD